MLKLKKQIHLTLPSFHPKKAGIWWGGPKSITNATITSSNPTSASQQTRKRSSRGRSITATKLQKWVWGLDNSGSFSSSSFFLLPSSLHTSPNFNPLSLHKKKWKARIPEKIKCFAWTLVLNRINITNLSVPKKRPSLIFHRCAHKCISPNECVLGFQSGESVDHLFLHSSFARTIWNLLFSIFEENWVAPDTVATILLIHFSILVREKKTKLFGMASLEYLVVTQQ